jgi:sugar-specific transcriptional regulator TrmB
MKNLISVFKKFGLSEKEQQIYLALLEDGSASVRKLSAKTGINRGSVYEALKELRSLGLVTYFHQDTRQYFAAENPEKLSEILDQKRKTFAQTAEELENLIPQLRSLYERGGAPIVKFYEGEEGIKDILKDLLSTLEQSTDKSYSVYSSADIRQYIFQAYPKFSEDRIKRKIRVRVVALGEGGQLVGLDKRKWLNIHSTPSEVEGQTPTYILIYDSKVSMISVDKNEQPIGVIIHDAALAQTQQAIFEALWEKL